MVESGVYRMCSGANKCVRGLLVSVGDEVKHCSRLPHFYKRVIILYICDMMVFYPRRARRFENVSLYGRGWHDWGLVLRYNFSSSSRRAKCKLNFQAISFLGLVKFF